MPADIALSHAPEEFRRDALRHLGPLKVQSLQRERAVREIVDAVRSKRSLRVAFANTHLLYWAVRDPEFAHALRSFYVINDGIGMTLLARLACGAGFEENLNGTDLTPILLAALPSCTRVFLVGARPSVIAETAATMCARWPQLEICGARDGFEGREPALAEIAKARPDIVLVGMGNPLQERWIARASAEAPRAVFLGVGALFDFLTGTVDRAPPQLRAMRLEWAYRLAHEPQRLWRRYTIEIFVILAALAIMQPPRGG